MSTQKLGLPLNYNQTYTLKLNEIGQWVTFDQSNLGPPHYAGNVDLKASIKGSSQSYFKFIDLYNQGTTTGPVKFGDLLHIQWSNPNSVMTYRKMVPNAGNIYEPSSNGIMVTWVLENPSNAKDTSAVHQGQLFTLRDLHNSSGPTVVAGYTPQQMPKGWGYNGWWAPSFNDASCSIASGGACKILGKTFMVAGSDGMFHYTQCSKNSQCPHGSLCVDSLCVAPPSPGGRNNGDDDAGSNSKTLDKFIMYSIAGMFVVSILAMILHKGSSHGKMISIPETELVSLTASRK
jgi:hypothetical protein